MSEHLRLYTQGATGGTPAQGAICYRLLDPNEVVLLEHAERIGDASGHEAGYRALLLGLSACEKHVRQRIHCYTDDELVVRQLRGDHPVTDPRIRQFVERVKRVAARFRHVEFSHAPRTDHEMALTGRMASGALGAG
jgi:ribonuclease HI